MEKTPIEQSVISDTLLDKDSVVKSITAILTEIINENMDPEKGVLRETQRSTSFFSKKIPSISVQSYFDRIMKYSKMEISTLIVVLIYIDKLCETYNFLLTENTIHR